MALGGNAYTEWWYTQENPTLTGIAAAEATVEIDINGEKSEVTAASGNWSYSPTTLTTGDHVVTITTGEETYSFTLHAGQALPEDFVAGGSGTGEVPATGHNQLLGMGIALVLFSAGYAVLRTARITTVFEKKILKDLD